MSRGPASRARDRVVHGDWQTPRALADAVLDHLRPRFPEVRAILEPTCGRGSFLVAAAAAYPGARLVGLDRSPSHLDDARAALGDRGALAVADCFHLDWDAVIAGLPEPLLVVGNPPWVTNAALGALGADNLPEKRNFKGDPGLAARTGRSNFDVSEWLILRLLAALRGRRAALAMLCKSAVARRVLGHAAARAWPLTGELRPIDARRHFAADVDAVLLTAAFADTPGEAAEALSWPIYAAWDDPSPARRWGVVGGRVVADLERALATRDLEGPPSIAWRSGVKHDCARVMELVRDGDHLINGHGERVDLEPDHLYPLLKGADLLRGRLTPRRAVLVPQTRLGQPTASLGQSAPRTWAYLQAHAAALAARRSRIYRGGPPFAVFGVGPYTFAPYKVAICGLGKRLDFRVLGPHAGRPVVVDDTCAFLPCDDAAAAAALAAALASPRAREFFEARIFWDAKRPLTAAVLGALSLAALVGGREGSTPP